MQMWTFGLSVASVSCMTQMHESVFSSPRGLLLLASYGKRSLGYQICGVPIKKENDDFISLVVILHKEVRHFITKPSN